MDSEDSDYSVEDDPGEGGKRDDMSAIVWEQHLKKQENNMWGEKQRLQFNNSSRKNRQTINVEIIANEVECHDEVNNEVESLQIPHYGNNSQFNNENYIVLPYNFCEQTEEVCITAEEVSLEEAELADHDYAVILADIGSEVKIKEEVIETEAACEDWGEDAHLTIVQNKNSQDESMINWPLIQPKEEIVVSSIPTADVANEVEVPVVGRERMSTYPVLRSADLPIISNYRSFDETEFMEVHINGGVERDEYQHQKKPKGMAKFIGQSKAEKEMALRNIQSIKNRKSALDSLQCNICKPPRTFTAPTTLLSHYKSHAGIKSYECHVCGSFFTRQHSLNYHMLIHSNQTRFTCPDCGRKFRHPSHFKEHKRRHTGEAPFECSDCLLRFKTRNTYKRHLKTRHGKILTTGGGLIILSAEEFEKVRTMPRNNRPKDSSTITTMYLPITPVQQFKNGEISSEIVYEDSSSQETEQLDIFSDNELVEMASEAEIAAQSLIKLSTIAQSVVNSSDTNNC